MARIYSAAQCRDIARRRLPYFAFDFVESGAGSGQAISRNSAALEACLLVPQALNGVHDCDLQVELFGQHYAAPFGIAPMGVPSVAWPGAEAGLARAADTAQIPLVLSHAASAGIGDIAPLAPGRTWFQLYHSDDPDHSANALAAADKAGVTVLVVTIDRPVGSWRLRDLINGVGLDYRLDAKAWLSLVMHPRWSLATLRAGLPRPVHLGRPATAACPAPLDWSFVRWLRDIWPHTFVIKGILNAGDARLAVDAGADGIIVSNHGGGQLSGSVAPISQLPAIRSTVGSDRAVMIDSGFRTGEDVAKALALGADFVFLGRAFAYATAALGPQQGPLHMAQLLKDELGRVLPILGYRTPQALIAAHDGNHRVVQCPASPAPALPARGAPR